MHSSILPTGQREPEVGDERLLERARDVLRIEAQAVLELVDTIDGDWLVCAINWPVLRNRVERAVDFTSAVTAAIRIALEHELAVFIAPRAVSREAERIVGKRPNFPRQP